MIGSMEQGTTSQCTSACNGSGTLASQVKHKVFLSHSGAQKGFVEQLCVDLERCDRPPFFDKCQDCLPIGGDFPKLIFEAIEQCEVGVVVLSEEFFTSKWPMLELVAMANVRKRKPSFTIMPILLGLSLSECRDVDNHKRWLSFWRRWADGDSRIDLQEWSNALALFGPTNALKYNFELGEVKYREEIVEAICRLVPPGTQFEDSHIQGRSHLCKVIHERIKESKVSPVYGVHVIGLHGFGGIGKTTLCKTMCNYVSEEYCGKVAHMELGSASEEELLKVVLQRLTNMNLERLGAMIVDEYRYHLMRGMMNVKVFLTIDNVSNATRAQALNVLQAKYGCGSVVLVTTRSLDELTSLGILAKECMEMLDLVMEEARSLFLHHAVCVPPTYLSNKDDHEVVSACVQRCYFKKGDGISYHYHPLALQTLGEQLGSIGYIRDRWRLLLHEIDFLNPFGEPQHPVFSILRRSFEALNSRDQFLFMDVALFAPDAQSMHHSYFQIKLSVYEWFGMMYGIPVMSVMERLENLKTKSLLENVDDGFNKISMHDLWREFARLETKVGEFEKRQWMFEWDEYNELEEASVTNGGPLGNMRRMFFLDKGFKKLEDVRFFCFPNMTVLKLHPEFPSLQQLDLTGLKHLKSLELDYIIDWRAQEKPFISLSGLGSLLKLVFLQWSNIPSDSLCIDEISRLTNLQVLDLYNCNQVPNLSNLILLQVARFHKIVSVPNITSFSSNHTKLQFLDLNGCYDLESCSSVGELVELQELCFSYCSKLIQVPNLEKLKQLRKLDLSLCKSLQGLPDLSGLVNLVKLNVFSCPLLQGLPGLGTLVSLVELDASWCSDLAELPNMCNLRNLKILDVRCCRHIKSLPGLNELVSLQFLHMAGCDNLTQMPDVHKLMNLRNLQFNKKKPLQSFAELSNLISLRILIVGVDEEHDGYDLCKLTMLTRLSISGLQGQGFSSLAELVLLESLIIHNCKGVRVLPTLQKLSRLDELHLKGGEFEDMSSLSHLTSLETLVIEECDKLEALPNLQELSRLKKLTVDYCARLIDVHGILGFQNLQRLRSSGNLYLHKSIQLECPRPMIFRILSVYCRTFANQQVLAACSQLHELTCTRCSIKELPDLAHFPKLSYFNVADCQNLTNLTCIGPISSALNHIYVSGCIRLQALPNLSESRKMGVLDVSRSGVVLNAQLIQDMKAQRPFMDLCIRNDDDDFDSIIEDSDENNDDDIDFNTEDHDEDE